jgi:hypothetical protein
MTSDYYEKNKDKLIVYQTVYNQAPENIERVREYKRNYYRKHYDSKFRDYNQRYYYKKTYDIDIK